MKKHIFLFGALFSLLLGNLQAQVKTEKTQPSVKTEQSRIETLLNSKNFEFIAKTMFPTGGTPKNLVGSGYSLSFSPEIIISHLPFYGRAYSGMATKRDKGMRFKGKPEGFTIEKKKEYQVNTSVNDGGTFEISLSVSDSGNATLSISSNNRETIRYQGEVIALAK